MKLQLIFSLGLVLLVAWLIGDATVRGSSASSLWSRFRPDDLLHIVVCDVGQGDALLITQGYKQLLVDGGPTPTGVLKCLAEFMPFGNSTLEWVIATHYDADHIGGLPAVLERYQVQRVVTSPVLKSGEQAADFLEQVRTLAANNRLDHLWSQPNLVVHFSQTFELTTLWPPVEDRHLLELKKLTHHQTEVMLSALTDENAEEKMDSNNGSIVLLGRFGSLNLLLTGDIEAPAESALLEQNLIGETQVLKVAHHGSKTSSSSDFLLRTSPEISLVSLAQNNSYGHPDPAVIRSLEQIGSQVLRTDQLGTIELVTDGQRVWLAQRQ